MTRNTIDAFLRLMVMGLFESALPYLCYTFADKYLSPSLATVLMSLGPFFSIFIANIMKKMDPVLDAKRKPLSKKIILGIFVGFIGAGIVVARPYLSALIGGNPLPTVNYVGEIWVLPVFIIGVISLAFSSTYWSNYGVYTYPADTKVDVMVSSFARNFLGFVIMAVFAGTVDYYIPFTGKPHFGFIDQFTKLETWLVTLWMGIGSGYIGVISYYHLLKTMGAERALTSNYMVPVIGGIIGLYDPGTRQSYVYYDYIIQFGGTVIVVLGLVIASIDGLKQARRRRKANRLTLPHDIKIN
jgi:drug/metabolite transporter (DMT)-like permease